jgi:hypothetical protein
MEDSASHNSPHNSQMQKPGATDLFDHHHPSPASDLERSKDLRQ